MNDPYKNYGIFNKFKNACVCFAPFSIRGELPIFIKKSHIFPVNNGLNFNTNKKFLGFLMNDD